MSALSFLSNKDSQRCIPKWKVYFINRDLFLAEMHKSTPKVNWTSLRWGIELKKYITTSSGHSCNYTLNIQPNSTSGKHFKYFAPKTNFSSEHSHHVRCLYATYYVRLIYAILVHWNVQPRRKNWAFTFKNEDSGIKILSNAFLQLQNKPFVIL